MFRKSAAPDRTSIFIAFGLYTYHPTPHSLVARGAHPGTGPPQPQPQPQPQQSRLQPQSQPRVGSPRPSGIEARTASLAASTIGTRARRPGASTHARSTWHRRKYGARTRALWRPVFLRWTSSIMARHCRVSVEAEASLVYPAVLMPREVRVDVQLPSPSIVEVHAGGSCPGRGPAGTQGSRRVQAVE